MTAPDPVGAGRQAGRGAEDDLEDHVAESVAAIARVHQEHVEMASGLERGLDRVNALITRPGFAVGLTAALAAGIAVAAWGATDWRAPTETPLFAWIELAATLSALLIAVLILSTQRRQDALAEKRAVLTLELALLSERKTGKIIDLIEELRRDAPGIGDRADAEAEAMAKSADPGAILGAIEEGKTEGA